MEEKGKANSATPVERRRFLRESVRGSVPLLLHWAAGRARELAHLMQGPASVRKTSSPPAASESAPSAAKESLEQRQAEFARDNPDQSGYPDA